MEDYARFVLNDPTLSAHIKTIRHQLAGMIKEHDLGNTIRARDIIGDVGCHIETPAEYDRESLQAPALAAGKRFTESLRSIEEYAKPHSEALARLAERVRYQGYEIERQLMIRAQARQRFTGVGLYVLITESLCAKDWFAVARSAIEGGADCLQLREKNLSDKELLDRASQLASLCRDHGVLSIINDRPDIASAAAAGGVHLGQDDLPVAAVRALISPDMLLGLSTHNLDQIHAAAAASPDYVAVGPVFASSTKPQNHVAGLGTLRIAAESMGLPVVAIGGIDATNVGQVAKAGCNIASVCSAVIAQPDVAEAARAIKRELEEAEARQDIRTKSAVNR